MSVVLDRQSEVVYNSTKKRMEKELKDLIFNLELRMIDKKEWKKFQDKLLHAAFALISEINRSQNNYRRVGVQEISKDFQSNDEFYFFDFFGDNGTVRMVFKKGLNGYIQFNHIEEEIYEERLSLF